MRPRRNYRETTTATAWTGTFVFLFTELIYESKGVALSRANAQRVRDVDVTPAMAAAVAMMTGMRDIIVAPTLELVVSRYICMKGNPVGVPRRDSREPAE